MSARGILRRWRWLLAGAGLAAAAWLGALHGPDLLRELEWFRVRSVEVAGTRFLEPYAAVRAAGINEGSSVFDDPRVWRAGIEALPLVDGVTIRRRLPGTLLIEIREAEPVALVAGGDRLQPVDWRGRALDLDPAGAALDLPVLSGVAISEDRLEEPGESALLLLSLLHEHDGRWADRVSQLELVPGAVRVVFRGDGPDALVPLSPTPSHVRQLRLAYADLSARGELGRARRIDVRFRDQVVVSFLRTPLS